MLDVEKINAPADFLYMPQATSSMDLALDLAQQGQPHLTALYVEELKLARGRRGRTWHHVAGCNLALTLILRENTGEHLPLVVALALYQAVSEVIPRAATTHLAVKWPNDVLWYGKKLAGVLVEKHGDVYVVGIGMNIKQPPAQVRAGLNKDFSGIWLEQNATGQKQFEIEREDVVNAFFTALTSQLALYGAQGWNGIVQAYTSACSTIGQQVYWQTPQEEIAGTARGLTPTGALDILTTHGVVHTIRAGDIIKQGISR